MPTLLSYKISRPFASLLCLLLCALVAPAHAAVFTLPSSADAFLAGGSTNASAGSPTLNYGGAGALMISPVGAAKGELQTLLRFDLSSAKSSFDSTYGVGAWTISSITLQLGTNFGTQGAQPNNAIFNSINAGRFSVDWLASDNWVEGTGAPSNGTTDGITYTGLAALLSGGTQLLGTYSYVPVGNTAPPSIPPATYALGLENNFVADAAAGNLVSLRAYAADTSVGYLFNSRSFGTAANRPTLLIDAIPEPGSLWLSALGIVGLGLYAVRRSRCIR